MAPHITARTVVSYTAFSPLPSSEEEGGISLLHCPGSRLRRPLTGILPCEARTFLTPAERRGRDRLLCLQCSKLTQLPEKIHYTRICPMADSPVWSRCSQSTLLPLRRICLRKILLALSTRWQIQNTAITARSIRLLQIHGRWSWPEGPPCPHLRNTPGTSADVLPRSTPVNPQRRRTAEALQTA